MFHRSTRLISVSGALVALPLAFMTARQPSPQLAVSIAASPVTVGVQVAMHPLDLTRLSASDFGDSDTVR